MGVDLFFVLSGFLITGILLSRKELKRSYFSYFYSRRARRILAPYLLLLAVSSALFGFGWTKYWYWYLFFSTNIAGALNQVGHDSLVPLWSLGVEEQFYIVWPVVILLASEKALVRIAVGLVALAPLLRAVATPLFSSHFPIYFLTPFRMDLLAAGALLCVIWRRDHTLFFRLRHAANVLIVAAILLIFWLSRYPQFRTNGNTIFANTTIYSIILVLVCSILGAALSGRGSFCRILRLPALRYLGTISYSMYLIHMTAIIITKQLIGSRIIAFIASLVATILYATITWYLFEKRLLFSNPRNPLLDRMNEVEEPEPQITRTYSPGV